MTRLGADNSSTGTAIITQIGVWILVILIWASILTSPIALFTGHPLLNSVGLLLIVQATLLLQPTHTARQKNVGTKIHSVLNGVGVAALIAGLIVIEVNKGDHARLTSVHGRLGLATYILFVLQAAVGFVQFYAPSLLGGEARAKSIYKYHRVSGYALLIVALAAICAATQTGFNKNSLHLKLWAVIVASVLILVGLVPRIKLQKLGLKR